MPGPFMAGRRLVQVLLVHLLTVYDLAVFGHSGYECWFNMRQVLLGSHKLNSYW